VDSVNEQKFPEDQSVGLVVWELLIFQVQTSRLLVRQKEFHQVVLMGHQAEGGKVFRLLEWDLSQ
jgi:hypothetical protein